MTNTDWMGKAAALAEVGVGALARARRMADDLRGSLKEGPAGGDTRFTPAPFRMPPGEEESPSTWGFADTHFRCNPAGEVELTGGRYALSGETLPNLLPWIRDVMQSELSATDTNDWTYPPVIPQPVRHEGLLADLRGFLPADQMSEDPVTRLRHGHGHTQEEMFAVKYGNLERVPDLVVFPTEEAQVEKLVQAAQRHGVVLIPYGGGTNVTEALRCRSEETRTIVSVDMRRMNRILWMDPVNRMACIQAGAVGRHIAAQLKDHGFTMGHEPDSIEFSTLGGWIATNASGMKKNKYGNIEDIVLDVNVLTAAGRLERFNLAPREAIGNDPRKWLFGSEGRLGIITQAVVKLFPLPELQNYGSILFPTFEAGVAFMYEMTQAGSWPASARLVDNLQFQFSMALKPASKGWRARKSKVEKLYVTKVRGFDPQQMVACTLVFEGSKRDVENQEAQVYGIAERHGGMKAGSENGARGYQLTYGIAYIRDFVMNHWVLAESFETSVPWSQVLSLCDNVKRRVYAEHAKRNLPGKPFVTCRVTQVYDTGVCIYFYFAYNYKGVANPTTVYHAMEHAAREEILSSGGSLSHHHGVGKLRQGFLPQVMSRAALDWSRDAKRAFDPDDVFGCGNQQVDDAAVAVPAAIAPVSSRGMA